jgi:hypothetical protein
MKTELAFILETAVEMAAKERKEHIEKRIRLSARG